MANIADWFNEDRVYCFKGVRSCADDARVQYLYLMNDVISGNIGCLFIPEGESNPLKTLPECLSGKFGTESMNRLKVKLGWNDWTDKQVMDRIVSDKKP